ncbi:MAG: DNA topoisomerase [Hymenobacter sp.]
MAQKLYEAGRISYMRTDSVNLSRGGRCRAQRGHHGRLRRRVRPEPHFKTKSASAQEAHEAIRPTDFKLLKAGADASEQRLYDLIRKRATGSQMAMRIVERTTAVIGISTQPGAHVFGYR